MACMVVFSWPNHYTPVFHLSRMSSQQILKEPPIRARESLVDRVVYGDHVSVDLNGMPILFAATAGSLLTDKPPCVLVKQTLVQECGFRLTHTKPNNLSCSGYRILCSGAFVTRAYLYPPGTSFIFSQKPGHPVQVTYPWVPNSDDTRLSGHRRDVQTVTTTL